MTFPMSLNPVARWVACLALSLAAPAAWADDAPLEGFELGAGYTRFQLKPASTLKQDLNGAFLAGRVGWSQPWSIEGEFRRETGRDSQGVSLRQWGLQVGPRYTWVVAPKVELFAHALVGVQRLEAEQGVASDHKISASASPGVGVDLSLNPRLALRVQVDEMLTRYAGRNQQNLAVSLGLAYRWTWIETRRSGQPGVFRGEVPIPTSPRP